MKKCLLCKFLGSSPPIKVFQALANQLWGYDRPAGILVGEEALKQPVGVIVSPPLVTESDISFQIEVLTEDEVELAELVTVVVVKTSKKQLVKSSVAATVGNPFEVLSNMENLPEIPFRELRSSKRVSPIQGVSQGGGRGSKGRDAYSSNNASERAIMHEMAKVKQIHGPVVVAGDFNAITQGVGSSKQGEHVSKYEEIFGLDY
ncbi:hypothetical protein LINPERPRIM_LOCUS21176 [Linum perenne]